MKPSSARVRRSAPTAPICGTPVDRHAFVAVGAVVNRDVAPFALTDGVRAKRIGWKDWHGHLRVLRHLPH